MMMGWGGSIGSFSEGLFMGLVWFGLGCGNGWEEVCFLVGLLQGNWSGSGSVGGEV